MSDQDSDYKLLLDVYVEMGMEDARQWALSRLEILKRNDMNVASYVDNLRKELAIQNRWWEML